VNRRPLAHPLPIESLFCQCHVCGFVYISTHFVVCPFCESKDVFGIPFREHKGLSFSWLENHGFPYLEKLVGGESLLSEFEIKNIIEIQKEQLEQIYDPNERKLVGAFIAGLECVLNE